MRKCMKKAMASIAFLTFVSNAITMSNFTTVSASVVDEKPAMAIEEVFSSSMAETDFTSDYTNNNLDGASKGTSWYYYTGTTIPSGANPVYSKYRLLSVVQPGDIIYEANGGLGITGHCAIVEGIYYCAEKNMRYIRIIEAIEKGVTRSILDDTRVDDKDVSIYRVKGASSAQKQAAINFCVGELGSTYFLDFQKDTSASETDWYCSELVWAGYKNQGIDVETTGYLNEPGITPRDISRSSKVTKIEFK